MVAKRRITKKRLKQPDEFITWGSRAMNYAITHIRYLIFAAVLIAAAIIALFLWHQHVTTSEENAFNLLGKGLNIYHQDTKSDEALQVFTEVIRDYPRTKAGKLALLYRGRFYLFKKDYDSAIADFTLFLKKSSDVFLRAIAHNALGYAYSAQKDYQRSVENFQQALASDEEWLKPYVLISIGMCWEKLGEPQKAADSYTQSLELSPAAPWSDLAKVRIKKLKGKKN